MKKIILSLLTIVLASFMTVQSVFAQEYSVDITTPTVATSSYELFWPLVAGKTTEDPWYFLKLFKEQIRGLLIFGDAQKADYEVMIATKRILEADALLKKGNHKLADETLGKAMSQLLLAKDNLSKAQKSNQSFQSVKVNLINQLSNLNVFLPQMIWLDLMQSTEVDTNVKVNQLKELVKQLLSNLQ